MSLPNINPTTFELTIPLDEYERLHNRIKELEKENESLKYSVATLDTDLAMMKRWRKVSEELPEKWERVLLYAPKYGVGFGYWAFRLVNNARVWDFRQERQNSVVFKPVLEFENVTHWMPLPEFKEEKR